MFGVSPYVDVGQDESVTDRSQFYSDLNDFTTQFLKYSFELYGVWLV